MVHAFSKVLSQCHNMLCSIASQHCVSHFHPKRALQETAVACALPSATVRPNSRAARRKMESLHPSHILLSCKNCANALTCAALY